ncbi:MAG: DUF1080 domain-containing protein [Prevotellaceae bacterium]|jgi:hypothetical protein|nr:DUF1080 domain-containing protein [Prevotellaceae bacterium]
MHKQIFLSVIGLFAINSLSAQWTPKNTEWYAPVPPVVKPAAAPGQPPSDAVVLFDGKDLSKWETLKGEEPKWTVEKGEMTVVPGTGEIRTKEYFGDCQLHIEFKSPKPGEYSGQMRGNSGVFLQSIYELQVLDADDNPTYVNGMVGSIYKQSAPLANAYTRNGAWQVYDVYWKAPKFGTGGKLEEPAMITVVLNGVVVQNNYVLQGGTEYIGLPDYKAHGRMPLMLQDHGTAVVFRNIWIRNL